MRSQIIFLSGVFLYLFLCGSVFRVSEGASIADDCNEEFTKVTECLDYSTGKAATPSKACCEAVKDIKDNDPKCLCYFIQQTHNGSETIKSLGILESRLLQLPSSCHLTNASITNCPKLLGLAPGSPDAAIFTNASLTAPPTGTSSSSASEKNDDSSGTKHGPGIADLAVVMFMAIFYYAFPAGSGSIWG